MLYDGMPLIMATFYPVPAGALPCTCAQKFAVQQGVLVGLRKPLNLRAERSIYQLSPDISARQPTSTRCSGTSNSSSQAATSVQALPNSASEAVQKGQQAFDRAEYGEALQLFSRAMSLSPNDDEARAALYNGACAKAKLKQWQGAADDVTRAVNDYKLKLDVAVKVRMVLHTAWFYQPPSKALAICNQFAAN